MLSFRKDFAGKKFGRLTALRPIETIPEKGTIWEFVCDCGNKIKRIGTSVVCGNTSSCGCLGYNWGHGDSLTRFYRLWKGIVTRTNGTNSPKSVHLYKGLSRWKSYKDFKKDMFGLYERHVAKYGEKQTSIDRIDPLKGYSKENCRWVTLSFNSAHTRRARFVEYKGRSLTIRGWAKEFGAYPTTLNSKLKRGISMEQCEKDFA